MWILLRHLLNSEESKATYRQNINTILHAYDKTEKAFIDEITTRYLSWAKPTPHLDYTGTKNRQLDEEISKAELRAVLQKLNTTSALGLDGITNKTIRNLDDASVDQLTKYINKCWQFGAIPQQWKMARIILIPKPGKRLQLENLRPISLTSCVGKLMEHVVLMRLTNYLEDNDILPPTMLGFQRNLSTRDAMLQLKHRIIDNTSRKTKAILGLDLKKAFDSVTHGTILNRINELSLDQRVYTYIQNFLTNRKANIKMEALTLKNYKS